MTNQEKDNRYMIIPYDLTERQVLIYITLYKRCDFKTMQISITIDDIVSSIGLVNLTYKMVYGDIKKMCKSGYIEVIRKASKGTAPTYKIIKSKQEGNQRETKGYQRETKTEHLQAFEGYGGYQRETKGYQRATNSKDKDKDNIYSRVITQLNKQASKNFKSTTKKTIACIDARLNEGFTEDDFYKVINIKCNSWLHDAEMNKYLRPETLFGNKFESYLNESFIENEKKVVAFRSKEL